MVHRLYQAYVQQALLICRDPQCQTSRCQAFLNVDPWFQQRPSRGCDPHLSHCIISRSTLCQTNLRIPDTIVTRQPPITRSGLEQVIHRIEVRNVGMCGSWTVKTSCFSLMVVLCLRLGPNTAFGKRELCILNKLRSGVAARGRSKEKKRGRARSERALMEGQGSGTRGAARVLYRNTVLRATAPSNRRGLPCPSNGLAHIHLVFFIALLLHAPFLGSGHVSDYSVTTARL